MRTSTKIIIALAILMIGLYLMGMASALNLESFTVNPLEVAPGKTADISILLNNNAEDDAEDIRISLNLENVPFAPYNSGSDASRDVIESDESKRIGFEVIALNDATPGIYKIPVHVNYKEDEIDKSFDSLISIMINSEPILEIINEDSLLLEGQQNQITVKIINKGLADIKFLELELEGSSYYNILSPKRVYIGDVDNNDFQTADYKIFFNSNAPSTISIPVITVYKDITNKEYTQNSFINVRVYDQNEATNLGLVTKSYIGYYILIAIVLIVIFIIYRIIRNRRRRKAEEY